MWSDSMKKFFSNIQNSAEIITIILSLALILKMAYEFITKGNIEWQNDLKEWVVSLAGAIVFFTLIELLALLLKTIRNK